MLWLIAYPFTTRTLSIFALTTPRGSVSLDRWGTMSRWCLRDSGIGGGAPPRTLISATGSLEFAEGSQSTPSDPWAALAVG